MTRCHSALLTTMRVQLVVSAETGESTLSFTVTDENLEGKRSLEVNEVWMGSRAVLLERAADLMERMLDAISPEPY